ncbi:hypothetical protein TWF506_004604 [Arthrobotrys conoides]|uniref:Uncharacterized protein n=1 Tax=Arthrobotrys conoides TaxID=74498 RepID=A0AAN8MZZ5_9PEZI
MSTKKSSNMDIDTEYWSIDSSDDHSSSPSELSPVDQISTSETSTSDNSSSSSSTLSSHSQIKPTDNFASDAYEVILENGEVLSIPLGLNSTDSIPSSPPSLVESSELQSHGDSDSTHSSPVDGLLQPSQTTNKPRINLDDDITINIFDGWIQDLKDPKELNTKASDLNSNAPSVDPAQPEENPDYIIMNLDMATMNKLRRQLQHRERPKPPPIPAFRSQLQFEVPEYRHPYKPGEKELDDIVPDIDTVDNWIRELHGQKPKADPPILPSSSRIESDSIAPDLDTIDSRIYELQGPNNSLLSPSQFQIEPDYTALDIHQDTIDSWIRALQEPDTSEVLPEFPDASLPWNASSVPLRSDGPQIELEDIIPDILNNWEEFCQHSNYTSASLYQSWIGLSNIIPNNIKGLFHDQPECSNNQPSELESSPDTLISDSFSSVTLGLPSPSTDLSPLPLDIDISDFLVPPLSPLTLCPSDPPTPRIPSPHLSNFGIDHSSPVFWELGNLPVPEDWPWKPIEYIYNHRSPTKSANALLQRTITSAKLIYGHNIPDENSFARELTRFLSSWQKSPPKVPRSWGSRFALRAYQGLIRLTPKIVYMLRHIHSDFKMFGKKMGEIRTMELKVGLTPQQQFDYDRRLLQKAIDVRLGYEFFEAQFVMDCNFMEAQPVEREPSEGKLEPNTEKPRNTDLQKGGSKKEDPEAEQLRGKQLEKEQAEQERTQEEKGREEQGREGHARDKQIEVFFYKLDHEKNSQTINDVNPVSLKRRKGLVNCDSSWLPK